MKQSSGFREARNLAYLDPGGRNIGLPINFNMSVLGEDIRRVWVLKE